MATSSLPTRRTNVTMKSIWAVLLAFCSALAALALAPAALAQSNVDGYVYGSAAEGATVELKSVDTGYSRSVTATGGTFRFSAVPVGDYEVTQTTSSGKKSSQNVSIGVGAGVNVRFQTADAGATQLDDITVTGSAIAPVDISQTESVTRISIERIESMPIARDIQAVALLAPGTTEGDNRFTSQSGRPLISFGGSSPGENTFYLNGFNITDFRNFLGGATVPFQFFREFEVRTGGYSTEFGRSLGGVVNAVSKRGTNVWAFSGNAYFEPDSLRTDSPTVRLPNGDFRIDNRRDYRQEWQVNVDAGGPIIRDTLYAYAFVNLRDVATEGALGSTKFNEQDDSDPFYGVKVDWDITDGHSMEYTYFRDKTETDVLTYDYDSTLGGNGQLGSLVTRGTQELGGQTQILRYVGQLTDDLVVSALYGKSERTTASAARDANTGARCAIIIDARGGVVNPLGCWDPSVSFDEATDDTRDGYRLDFTWFTDSMFGRHTLKAGFDYEENVSETLVEYQGGIFYRYIDATPGASCCNGGTVPAGVTQLARARNYSVNGSFEEKLTAFYLEDSWQVTDKLLLVLGVRNETLENFNKNGKEFLGFDTQITPRFGLSYDLNGDGRTKLFANAGRYTMPIATNTNIRFAGGEIFTEDFFELQGTNADDTPILGPQIGSTRFYSDGSVPDPAASVDADIKPMFQDEMIVGLETAITDKTVIGAKYIYRKLQRAVEDSSFFDPDTDTFAYFLFNPGESVTLTDDFDGDGTKETVTFSAEQLGLPRAKRKYHAIELTADHQFSQQLFFGGSYTWSHSYGNFEGVFQSDIGQDDAGITIAFDEVGLTDFSYGNLPNDRRHKLKAYGSYKPVQDVTIGMNFSALSGRPKNALGNCPPDRPGYDGDCFYSGGEPSPRGSAGETSWIFNLDLGVRYQPSWLDGKLTAGFDVFNVLGRDDETRVIELTESAGGTPQPDYGLAAAFQAPRRVRASVEYKFGL